MQIKMVNPLPARYVQQDSAGIVPLDVAGPNWAKLGCRETNDKLSLCYRVACVCRFAVLLAFSVAIMKIHE